MSDLTGRKTVVVGAQESPENGSNRAKPLPPVATGCRSERMVRRESHRQLIERHTSVVETGTMATTHMPHRLLPGGSRS
jgi:hypothetical protein